MKRFDLVKLLAALAVVLFAFASSPGVAVAGTVQPPTDTSVSGELAFWNSIKASENPADFDVYLKTFPDGMFLDVAKSRYQALGGDGGIASAPKVETVEASPPPPETVQPETAAPVKVYVKPVKAASDKKYPNPILSKYKKAKKILAYRKNKANAVAGKRKTAVVTYKKPKVQKTTHAKIIKTAAKKKLAKPAKDAERMAGSGGGGGGSTGGGGGGGSPGGGGGGGGTPSW